MAITVEHDHRVHVPNNHITTVGGLFQVKSAGGGSGSGGGAGSGSGGGDLPAPRHGQCHRLPTETLAKSLSYTVGLSASSVTGLSLSSTAGLSYTIKANPIGVLETFPLVPLVPLPLPLAHWAPHLLASQWGPIPR